MWRLLGYALCPAMQWGLAGCGSAHWSSDIQRSSISQRGPRWRSFQHAHVPRPAALPSPMAVQQPPMQV